MAELKPLGRQIAQPNAPDISQAAKAYETVGNAVQKGAKTVGEYVKHTRQIEEKTILAGVSTDLERLKIKYANDPQLNMEKVKQFEQEANAISEGWLANAHPASLKTLISDVSLLSNKLTTTLFDDSYKATLRNEKVDISVAINELQDLYVKNIQGNQPELAAKNKQDLDTLAQSLHERGASAKELIAISNGTASLGIAGYYTSKLKDANSDMGRIDVMRQMAKLPDTPINTKAFNMAYTEFTRLNKLYKEGEDLSGPLANMLSGNSWLNNSLDSKPADQLVDVTAKNIANRSAEPSQSPVPVYQALPAYSGQVQTFDYNEDIQADREHREPRRYLANETAQALDMPASREPTLFELAQAHAMVGSSKATQFPDAVRTRLAAGPGAQANEAVEALNYIDRVAPATIALDNKTEILYSEFKIAKEGGRTDYDQMILDARNTIAKISESDLKLYGDVFDSQYSLTGGNAKALNKAFQEATGVDALKTDSTEALKDFYHYFKTNYIGSAGRLGTALDVTKRQMVRTHGTDRFSSTQEDLGARVTKPLGSLLVNYPSVTDFQYTRFPPSKMLSGMTSTQINNQLTEQLVLAAERNPNIKIPKYFTKIRTATDAEKMETNFAYPAPDWSAENLDANPANYITQHIEGVGDVEGRVFLKSNEYTAQNNTGSPVWEVWMQDRLGRQFPVTDNTSPINNTLIFQGQTAEQFVPKWAAEQDEEKIQENINQVLREEGRSLYPIVSLSPIRNSEQRKAYMADLENIERVEAKVRKNTEAAKK